MAANPYQLVNVPPNGTASVTYQLGAAQSLAIQSVYATANTVPAGGGGRFSVTYALESGTIIGRSICNAFPNSDPAVEVTWAPYLEDTAFLGGTPSRTELQTGLIDTVLTPGCRVTVANEDTSVVITAVHLFVVDVDAADAGTLPDLPDPIPLFLPIPPDEAVNSVVA